MAELKSIYLNYSFIQFFPTKLPAQMNTQHEGTGDYFAKPQPTDLPSVTKSSPRNRSPYVKACRLSHRAKVKFIAAAMVGRKVKVLSS